MIRAVVFDMDGVLFDSERISRLAWEQAGKEYSIDGIQDAVRDCTGAGRADQWEYLKKRYGKDFPAVEFRDRCSQIFHEYVAQNGLPLMPHALDTLEYLRDRGYVLALASSSRKQTVISELTEAGLLPFFAHISCGDQVAHSKPHPEIYSMTASALNIPAGECIAVEDSPNGIRSAYGAGLKPVMVPDQIQPSEEIKKLLYRLCTSLDGLREFL